MSESAGRVLMIPKGTYSPTTTYDPLDAVKYEHNSYVCKQTSRGNLPTNTTYWQPLTDVTADEIPTEDSTNLVQSGGVYSAIYTVNQTLAINGCKNVCPLKVANQTIKGITIATPDDDKYKVLNGTSTGNPLILSLLDEITPNPIDFTNYSNISKLPPEQLGIDITKKYIFSRNSYDGVRFDLWLFNDNSLVHEFELGTNSAINSIEIDFTSYTFDTIAIVAKVVNNIVLTNYAMKPMLCLKSDYDLDSTYEPYAKTNRQLTEDSEDSVTWDEFSKLGAFNYCQNTLNNQTVNGVTISVDDDGVITCSGNINANTVNQIITSPMTIKVPKGTYRWRASSDGSLIGNENLFAVINNVNGVANWYRSYVDNNIFIEVTTEAYIQVGIGMKNTTSSAITVNNTFYPMLCPVSYKGQFVPFAKTNKELTDALTTVHSGILTVDSENVDLQWNYGGASANDIAVSFKGFISTKRDATSGENSWINIGTLSKKPKASQQIACPRVNNSEGTIVGAVVSVDSNGNVLFNMRGGMKSGDQFATAGVILL